LEAQEQPDPDPVPELPESARGKTIDQTDPEFWAMAVEHTGPLAAEAYVRVGRRLLAEGTYQRTYRAVELLKQAVILHPEDAAVQGLYAEALVAPYRWTWDRDEVWLDRAAEALVRARALAPDSIQVLRVQSLLAMVDNRLQDAEEFLRNMLVQDPEDTETLLLLGAVLRLQDSYRDAYGIYQRALSLAPEDWRVYSGLADVYRDDEWYEEALTLYGKAQQLQPQAFPPRLGEALVFHRVLYASHALRLYRKLMEEYPDNANMALLAAAATHMRERQFGAALHELDQIEFGGHRGLCRGSVLYRMGLCRMRLGDAQGAIAAFREVMEEYPLARDGSDYGPLVMFPSATHLAALYEQEGLPEEAAEVLRRASRHPEAPLSVQLELADKLLSYGLSEMAVEVLRRGLGGERSEDLLAERVLLRVQLVRALAGGANDQGTRLGDVEDEVLEDGTSADCYQLARGHALSGEQEEAVQWLRRAVERGYRAYDLMRRDPDLESLRDLPDYRELVRGR
jgi:tetratricopeptide (TPR) repeat protein